MGQKFLQEMDATWEELVASVNHTTSKTKNQ